MCEIYGTGCDMLLEHNQTRLSTKAFHYISFHPIRCRSIRRAHPGGLYNTTHTTTSTTRQEHITSHQIMRSRVHATAAAFALYALALRFATLSRKRTRLTRSPYHSHKIRMLMPSEWSSVFIVVITHTARHAHSTPNAHAARQNGGGAAAASMHAAACRAAERNDTSTTTAPGRPSPEKSNLL